MECLQLNLFSAHLTPYPAGSQGIIIFHNIPIMAVVKTDLFRLSASQAAELIRSNHISAQEYAHALLERVRERDPQVRAWVYLDEEAVLEQAQKLDQLSPEERGPLHGVAIGVKDIFLTRGM